jgi:hypothetical protein
MNSRVVTLTLAIALAGSLLAGARQVVALRLPGNNQGYEPTQPIAYSHRLHAGELAIDCQYCHTGADRSRHAGIPAASTCMNCHQRVTAPWGAIRAEDELAKKEGRPPRPVVSAELAKLYNAVGVSPTGQGGQLEPDPAKTPRPIAWVRVHQLPDFANFDHSAHVNAGATCQTCHGPVQTMERLRQDASLSMGWCVDCHRNPKRRGMTRTDLEPSTDCAVCHQ